MGALVGIRQVFYHILHLSFLSPKFKENSASETDFHLDFGSGVGFGISKNFGK